MSANDHGYTGPMCWVVIRSSCMCLNAVLPLCWECFGNLVE